MGDHATPTDAERETVVAPRTREAGGRAFRPVRRVVVGLSVSFGIALTVAAWLVRVPWEGRSFGGLFDTSGLVPRMAVGAACGVAGAGLALAVVRLVPSLAGFRRLVRESFEGIEPRWVDLVLIATVAGWSEELFFRGVLQPVIGLWLAAVAFVVLHGIVVIRTWGRFFFGAMVFTAGVLLGLLYEWRGLEAAMTAHAAYDLTVLAGLRWAIARRTPGRGGPHP